MSKPQSQQLTIKPTKAEGQAERDALPKESWWLEVETRSAFDEAAARESLRMKLSREGKRA